MVAVMDYWGLISMKIKHCIFPRISAENTTPQLVSIEEGRRLSGNESRSSFYRALAAGEMDAVKRGRRTLVSVDSIRRRLDALPKAAFGTSKPANSKLEA
jgi:hypothetical protein